MVGEDRKSTTSRKRGRGRRQLGGEAKKRVRKEIKKIISEIRNLDI